MSSTVCKLFLDGGPYHIETNSLIFSANQWAGFCMIGTSNMKELKSKNDHEILKEFVGNFESAYTEAGIYLQKKYTVDDSLLI